MQLGRRRAALLMIDMQNGFIDPAGSVARIGFPVQQLAAAIAPCERLLAAARAVGLPVAHTRYVYQPGLTDGGVMVEHMLPELRRESALVAGTWDAETIPRLAALSGEAVFDKNRPSAVLNTELEAWLRAHAVTQVIVAGVTTSCCVETSVRDLSQRDFEVFIAADAVAEYDEERHRVSLKTLGLLFARVLEVRDIEAVLAGEAADAET
jgi:nicotinamidase-related amidase